MYLFITPIAITSNPIHITNMRTYLVSLPTLPFRGTVAASWGSPAEEELLDTISFDDWINPNKESSFLIKVASDAMIDAGIHPGDVLIVERGKRPASGDVVVAEVDNEWVLRYYQIEQGRPYLLPANGRYEEILPHTSLTVIGVVKACIRKY